MGLLFRPFRLILIIGAGFLAGLLFERNAMTDRCLDRGGAVDRGICTGAK
ncbi:hypothetical protein [Aliiroseovarius sediminis]|nr:hypothetical protein [Aliiroseovarius sediminis]MCI2395104.1 hypothetical protein [Aliiroseovarius sediminis]